MTSLQNQFPLAHDERQLTDTPASDLHVAANNNEPNLSKLRYPILKRERSRTREDQQALTVPQDQKN